jgi:hypothetical protein
MGLGLVMVTARFGVRWQCDDVGWMRLNDDDGIKNE